MRIHAGVGVSSGGVHRLRSPPIDCDRLGRCALGTDSAAGKQPRDVAARQVYGLDLLVDDSCIRALIALANLEPLIDEFPAGGLRVSRRSAFRMTKALAPFCTPPRVPAYSWPTARPLRMPIEASGPPVAFRGLTSLHENGARRRRGTSRRSRPWRSLTS